MAIQDNNVIPLDSKLSFGDLKRSQALLESVRAITLRYLPTLLKRMLDNADDTLFELADKAESNLQQTHYFDAMRELRLQRQSLEEGFQSSLEAEFSRFLATPATSTAIIADTENSDNMSLVDESDLEESLAVSATIAKVKNRLSRELYAIEKRFAALAPTKTIYLDDVPIGPKAVCDAFRSSLTQFETDTSIKLIIYKLFEKYVASNLEPLYEEVNTLFVEAGVMPHLKMVIKAESHSQQRNTTRPTHKNSTEPNSYITPTTQSLENGAGYQHQNNETISSTLQQLITQQYSARTQHNHIDPIDIINALSTIQMRDARFEPFETVEQLKEALSAEIHTPIAGGRLGMVSPIDNDIIDIVAMLFDFILDDNNLPSTAKALLLRLQIPMLKVAIIDKDIFSKSQHPARRLLNKMAQAAMGIDEDVRIENSPLLQKIDYIVNRAINNDHDHTILFNELLTEFERFHSLSLIQEAKIEESNQKQYEKREKEKLTSAWVMDCIANRIKDKNLPKSVYEIISGPWRQVMVNTYLNHSDESTLWKEQLRFVDLLVWSVEPKKREADKKRLANIILELLITLQDGLNTIEMKQSEIDNLLESLEACHIASMRGEKNREKAANVRVKLDTSTPSVLEEMNEIDLALAEMQTQLDKMNSLEAMLNTPLLDMDDAITMANIHGNGSDDETNEAIEIDEITITSNTLHEKVEPQIDDKFWRQTLHLKTGEWITLVNDDGKKQHLRLVWKSDYLGECSFTNWKFKVVAEFSFNELANLFRTQKASLIETLPLFERAIDTIMNTLHQRTSAARN